MKFFRNIQQSFKEMSPEKKRTFLIASGVGLVALAFIAW